jgi:murein DD-endopeptidase MepM/ murein hydrolase activator NlpD
MTANVIIQGQARRRRLLLAVAVCGMALSACGATPRYPVEGVQQAQPQYPVSPPPQPAPPLAESDAPKAKPSTPVQIQDLPPIGASARVTMAAPPPPGQTARATPPPAAVSAPVSSPPVPASVVATPTPGAAQEVIVAVGENLFDVAERTRTPVRALIELNGLQPPYALQPGARLKAPPALEYQIAPGDTLFGVARRFSIDPRSLATLNDMTLETQLRQGRRLSLPALARDQGAAAGATGPTPEGMALAEAARPAATPRGAPLAPPTGSSQTARREPLPTPVAPSAPATSDAAPSDQEVAAAGRGKFLWPVRGDILSGYGPKGPGQRNDGLNISANAGDTVKAAAAGEVVFAGELPGFGNLVLLKHDGGWVTAYAHLSKIGVRMRDTVAQGQTVGQVGQTGGTVDRPQLHFEIRYAASPRDKAKPVDPSILLPG